MLSKVASSATSSSSKASGKSAAKSVRSVSTVGGPVTIGQTVFLCVKRCPLCQKKNTYSNPVPRGPFGVEEFPFLIWNRGTSEDPKGRFDKACTRAYEDGGYSAEFTSVDQLVEARKVTPVLQKQWDKSYDLTIMELADGPIRASKTHREEFQGKMKEDRQRTVHSFVEETLDIDTPFRAVQRAKFEKQNPGKIEAHNLKTAWDYFDGIWQEAVLLPKNAEGEWDVTMKRRRGARMSEQIDDGSRVVREGQFQHKFDRVAKDTLQGARAALTNTMFKAPAAEIRKPEEEADEEEQVSEAETGFFEDEDNDDGLSFISSSFAAPASEGGWVRRSGSSGVAASPQPAAKRSGSTSNLAVSPSPSKKAATAAMTLMTSKKGGPGRISIGTKMAGKSPTEILDPLGLAEAHASFEPILAAMKLKPFATALIGVHLESLAPKCAELKKAVSVVQSKIVTLDNKVKKWKDVPEQVTSEIKGWRAKVAPS